MLWSRWQAVRLGRRATARRTSPAADGFPISSRYTGAQWKDAVAPYWSGVAEFAAREHPQLLVCLELHPGTVVYNVETFNRIAALGDSIAANIDPSHFFWMGMDPMAVVDAVGVRAGHCHGKDVEAAKVLAAPP